MSVQIGRIIGRLVEVDKYQSFRVFTEVAGRLSFSASAEALNLPKATVSTTIQDLETSLGVRLLNRTTRRVSLTPEGASFLDRCKGLLHDLDEAEAMFRPDVSQIKGRIRVDMGVTTAQDAVIPRLPEFLARYPMVEIELSSTDYAVDLAREGMDCVLRAGGPSGTHLIERFIGEVIFINAASPSYIHKYGLPSRPEDLAKHHRLIQFVPAFGEPALGFEYWDGTRYREIKMNGSLTVNNTAAYKAACLAGFGIAQISLAGARKHLADGTLVEILPGHRAEPSQLKIIYHQRRLLTQRVRIFMDWLEGIVAEYFSLDLSAPGGAG